MLTYADLCWRICDRAGILELVDGSPCRDEVPINIQHKKKEEKGKREKEHTKNMHSNSKTAVLTFFFSVSPPARCVLDKKKKVLTEVESTTQEQEERLFTHLVSIFTTHLVSIFTTHLVIIFTTHLARIFTAHTQRTRGETLFQRVAAGHTDARIFSLRC
jgi:hypothetical protein